MGKTFLYVSIGVVIFFTFFILLTWYAIRDTSENWSDKKEYEGIAGQTFHTTDTVFLTKQFEHEHFKEGYRLDLDRAKTDSASLVFPVHTEIKIASVEYTKRGVSGVEYIYILGIINRAGESIPFEYIWATPKFYPENESDKWKYTAVFWK